MKLKTVLITAAVAAAAVGGGWLLVRPAPTPAAAAAATTQQLSAGAVTAPSGALRNVIPTDVTWQLVNTIAVPVSPTAGPTQVSAEGIRSGFTHTPSGALMAAANYAAGEAQRFAAPGPATTAIVDQRVLPWPGHEQDKAGAIDNAAHPVSIRLLMQIGGFRFLGYDGDHATILIAEHITTPGAPQSGYTSWINLVWVDGDWWIQPAIDGHGEISTSNGWPLAPEFTAWTGVA